MAIQTIEIRDVGDEVVVLSKNGVERGIVAHRDVQKDNAVKYAIRTESQRNNTHRLSQEVFDDIDQLLTYYKDKFA